MCQVEDMEMSALHHHGLDNLSAIEICCELSEWYIYECCRLLLGNMPPRIPVAVGMISPIILEIPQLFKLALP